LRFSRKRQDESAQIFFQGLGQNTCLLESALKSNAPGHESKINKSIFSVGIGNLTQKLVLKIFKASPVCVALIP